jgi:hypothetical protein
VLGAEGMIVWQAMLLVIASFTRTRDKQKAVYGAAKIKLVNGRSARVITSSDYFQT